MTDTAVVADSGAAPIDGAPINETPANLTNPLGSQIPPDAQAKPDAKPTSLDDALDRAIAKNNAKQAEPAKDTKPEAKVDAKPAKDEPAKPEQARENGKFVSTKPVEQPAKPADAPKPAEQAKPSYTADDAPARFTESAKAKWAAADPEIRGETLRMQRELTDGYEKHKQAAERDSTVSDFHEMATKSGTTLKDVLTRYTTLENKLRQDLVGGLDEIVANATGGKYSLRDVAASLLNQTPDQNASQQDATIRELRNEISSLKEQFGGVAQTVQQQREQATLTEVNKFASENPRFEELANDIAFFMQSGRAKDLAEAYQLAERLNPAPALAAAVSEVPAASSAVPVPAPVHPDKGEKSITGAPADGLTSQPGKKRSSKSLDEALERAFSAVG